MFGTICFQHWRLWFQRPRNAFNMFCCTCDDCTWCTLHLALHAYKPNKRFIRNLERHLERLKLKKLSRTPSRFLISE